MSKGFRPKKAMVKRIKVTGTGKLLRRSTKMNHFEAKESSKKSRKDRKEFLIAKSDEKAVKQLLP
ncbi:MAG: 50S ribosomal protein L35 [Patescibacteria group bacterium]